MFDILDYDDEYMAEEGDILHFKQSKMCRKQ